MMDQHHDALATRAAQIDASRGVARWGVVTSVDPAKHLVMMTMEPDHSASLQEGGPAVLSGWLPVLSRNVGEGWRVSQLPTPGTQVFAVPELNEPDHLVVVGAAHGLKNTVAAALAAPDGEATYAQPGELLLAHSSGAACLRLLADGTILSRGAWVHDGTITTTGDLVDGKGPLDRLRQAYDAHTHGGVQTGSGRTGEVDQIGE